MVYTLQVTCSNPFPQEVPARTIAGIIDSPGGQDMHAFGSWSPRPVAVTAAW